MKDFIFVVLVAAVIIGVGSVAGLWMRSFAVDRCEEVGGEYARGICFKPGVIVR
jgi:hypothetical protein